MILARLLCVMSEAESDDITVVLTLVDYQAVETEKSR